MKNIIAICTIISWVILMPSCRRSLDEFLEKAPGVDVDENTVFSSKVNVDAFVSSLYEYGMFSIMPNRQNTGIISNPSTGVIPTPVGTLNAATDEGKNETTFQFANNWNTGTVTAQSIITSEDWRYYARWKAIRMSNILLERVDELKDPAADDSYKKQVKAQAKFIRALQNFEMLKRYGGIPLAMKRIVTSGGISNVVVDVPRSTLAETVDAIVRDCNEAYADVDATYASAQRGRVTKLAVLALKSRTLLYAASPLFNTATPYLNMADAADNKYICYGNFDNNRWKLAADAAMEVLTFAGPSGISLVDVPANRKPLEASANLTSYLNGNYRVSWENQNNNEIILSDRSNTAAGNNFSQPWQNLMPQDMGGFFGGTSVLLNFVKKYEDTLGRVVTWSDAGGNDLLAKYRSLDPRFKQSIGYVLSRWNASHPSIEAYAGGKHNRLNWGGQWMLKPVPEGISNGSVPPFLPMFKLNEFYLNYAEAMNEFSDPGNSSVAPNAEPPNIPTSAYDAVNRIRARSAMPKLPDGLSRDQFRTRVRNERAIELAFEDHRFWDVRRWLIAEEEGVMKGAMYGIKNTMINATTFNYMPYLIENRSFNKNMYLHPFELNEVLKGNLVQNPGW